VHAPQAQEACLGRRTVWGQASKGHPGSQSLIGGSLRRPAKVSEPYWGKPQDATLGPGALLGQASGSQPASQSLIGGSLKKPPFVPEPYWGKPPLRGFLSVLEGAWAEDGPRWPQDGPKRPKPAPRRPQETQDGPKDSSRWPQDEISKHFWGAAACPAAGVLNNPDPKSSPATG
jgi:hypothetical protein